MSNIIQITDFLDPALDVYARLTENQLVNREHPEEGLFIAESPKVIDRALNAGCQPVSILVETFGTGTVSDEQLANAVKKTFDLRPGAIIRDLDLRRPIYRQTAAYGHFGRSDLDLPWEKTDRVDALKANL